MRRITFILMPLLISAFNCSKKKPVDNHTSSPAFIQKVSLSSVVESQKSQNQLKEICLSLERNPVHTDSLGKRSRFVIVKNSFFLDVPDKSISIRHNPSPSQYAAPKGTVVWKISDSPVVDGLVPVYTCAKAGLIHLEWLENSALRPLIDSQSVADIIADSAAASRIVTGAIISRDHNLVSFALQNGAFNYYKNYHNPSLELAAKTGYSEIFPLILQYYKLPSDFNILYYYSHARDTAGIRKLINLEDVDNRRQAFEYIAKVMNSDSRSLQCLKSAMFVANLEILKEMTPLRKKKFISAAAYHSDTALLSRLLSACNDEDIDTLYPGAVTYGKTNLQAVLYLLRDGEIRRAPGMLQTYNKVLKDAIQLNDSALCALMISKGASPDEVKRIWKIDPITSSCRAGHGFSSRNLISSEEQILRVVRLLVKSGADVNGFEDFPFTNQKKSALIYALENKHFKVADFLISAGADIHFQTNRYDYILSAEGKWTDTPLMIALKQGNAPLSENLVKAGAQLKGLGFNALDAVCLSNNLSLFKILLEKGMKVDSTQLLLASYFGSDSIVDYITEHYPTFNRQFSTDLVLSKAKISALGTALYGARYRTEKDYWENQEKFARTVITLLNAGYDINEQFVIDGESLLPIEVAAKSSRFDLVDLLKASGAAITGKVIRYSLDHSDPSIVKKYLAEFKPEGSQFPHEDISASVAVASNLLRNKVIDSATVTTLKDFYRKNNRNVMQQLKTIIASRVKSYSVQSIHQLSLIKYVLKKLELFKSADDTYIRQANFYSKTMEAVKIDASIYGMPLILNDTLYSNDDENNYPSPTWFRHYNPHLIDALAKLMSVSEVAEAIKSFGESQTFSFAFTRSNSLPGIANEFISGYEQLMEKDSGRAALSVYDNYFREPFNSLYAERSFSMYDSPEIAGFWARRMLDGSAVSFINLFRTVSSLFEKVRDEDQEYSDEED